MTHRIAAAAVPRPVEERVVDQVPPTGQIKEVAHACAHRDDDVVGAIGFADRPGRAGDVVDIDVGFAHGGRRDEAGGVGGVVGHL